MTLAHSSPDIPKTLPDGYLVLPFENQSGVTGLDWMRAALPAALAEKLEAHPALRPTHGPMILPPGPPLSEVTEEEVRKRGSQADAKWVFTGAFSRPQWKLEITLSLWSVEAGGAALVGKRTERGEFPRAFEMLDSMALDLLGTAGRRAAPAAIEKIQRVPTKDFYSFTLFGRGLTAAHGLGKPPDLAKAEKDLSKAVFIDPKYAEAHRLLAVVYDQKGEEAKARGRRAFSLDVRPDYYMPLVGLVRSAFAAKDREEGIALAGRALVLRPWDMEVRYLLAEMLLEEGNVDGAHLELTRLVAVKPDHIQARRALVLVHATKGASQDLAEELEVVTRLDPTDEAAKLDLGAAYVALGKDSQAISIYETVARDNPKQILALKLLGDLHKQRGDLHRAIDYYEKALVANRNDPRPYFLL
ncbi:MAG: tetratricopeptide repeat protein, partial [Deltaproteobacteria bacterium]|nr:tetratricopeptide repeat protein [Deltaproteobacteria bacterium]